MPVEVRVLDGRKGAAISDASHAVMRDVSAGGARLDVLESAAGALADFKNGVGYLQLKLVTPELANKEPLRCRIRWSRPMPGGTGWTVGIQFGDEEGGPCHWLVDALERHRTRAGRMSTPARVLLAAALVLVLAPGLYFLGAWSSGRGGTDAERRARRLEQQTEEAQHQIESLSARADRSSQSVTALQEQLQGCRDDLNQQPVELGAPPAPAAAAARAPEAAERERRVLLLQIAGQSPAGAPALEWIRWIDGRLRGKLTVAADKSGPDERFSLRLVPAPGADPLTCPVERAKDGSQVFECPALPTGTQASEDAGQGIPVLQLIASGVRPHDTPSR